MISNPKSRRENKMAQFKLSQTVAGTWVITTPNPEERGWETQLAEFDMTRVTPGTPSGDALEQAAAASLATIVITMTGYDVDDEHTTRIADAYDVISHDPAAETRMQGLVKTAFSRMRNSF